VSAPGAPPPSSSGPPPKPPHAAVLGDARITINALPHQVFDALTNAERLNLWWGEEALFEPDVGGRFEATFPTGRIEGTITTIDGPHTLVFTWPMAAEEASVITTVHYDVIPKGPQTVVHVLHRSPRDMPGDWASFWRGALEALKAYLEAAAASPPPDGEPPSSP